MSGLADQGELFAYASALEGAPGVRGVGLVRADDMVGVFSVLTSSRQDLVEACQHVPGFTAVVRGAAPGWDVLEVTVARETTEAPVAPAPRPTARPRFTLLSDDATLPRSRLPVFGRRSSGDAEDAAPDARVEDAFPADAPRWSALDDAIETVLITDSPSSDSEPLWPPVEVDVFAPALDLELAEREVVHLVAAPLRSFGQVNAFRDRLAELEGVIDLKVGRFYRGALQVTVDYADAIPLFDRLQELREFAPRALRQRDARTIEITLPG